MKLKHWQGYGCLDVKKTGTKSNRDGTKTVQITVTGMHEYGLVTRDAYNVHNWLLRRFAKDCPDYRAITNMAVREADDGGSAVYDVTYRPEA